MSDGNVALEKEGEGVAHSFNCTQHICWICILLTHLFYNLCVLSYFCLLCMCVCVFLT